MVNKKVQINVPMSNGHSLQVSCGNSKMSKGFGIFNIAEKVTCIGKTQFCTKWCYAEKASRLYPSVFPRRQRNTEATKQADFVPAMLTAIEKLVKKKGFNGMFRIHEAGDFYCQTYVDAWATIASNFPSVRFLAFTKSFSLDFSGMPENVQVVWSVMEDTDTSTVPAKGMIAYAGNAVLRNSSKTLECPGTCDNCGACWNLGKTGYDVHFSMH